MSLKYALAKASAGPAAGRLFRPLMRGHSAIFMMHRFGPNGERGHHSAQDLRAGLELLHRLRIPVVSLGELVRRLEEGRVERAAVLTVDDGYHDFHEIAAPIFREFDCPVTVFVTTGFVDRQYWFWWDQLRYALQQTKRRSATVDGLAQQLDLSSEAARNAASSALVEWVKAVPEAQRAERVDAALRALDVELPVEPPAEFRPMTWNEIRASAAAGAEFAPHTVTHPSMHALDPARLQTEVRESYARLTQELPAPVPVFCYPYGKSSDFSDAAVTAIAAEGMKAAVTAEPGYVNARHSGAPFLLPRFSFDPHTAEFGAIAGGFERFKEILRR